MPMTALFLILGMGLLTLIVSAYFDLLKEDRKRLRRSELLKRWIKTQPPRP